MYNERKTSGMTLLMHISRARGRLKKRNPNGIVGVTVGQAEQIIAEFKDMKAQRDEAMRILGLRSLPNGSAYQK
jgi:hypothetical protein